jgi:uncharacterized protein (DUF1778 family)
METIRGFVMAIGSQDVSMELQISVEQKSLIEEAAALSGQPITAFTISAAVEAARHVIRGERAIQLSSRDWERFLKLLDDPPEPSDHLKRAVARYKLA